MHNRAVTWIAIAWALLQLWLASPLPFWLGVGVWNSTEARILHLGFAILLVYATYPPWRVNTAWQRGLSWGLGLFAVACATYPFWQYDALAQRAGAPIALDVWVSVVGLGLLLIAAQRSLGWMLPIVAAVFLLYTFAGPYMPEVIAHKGFSLERVASHQWLSSEGVFGVPLGVSTSFVFLFVLFGAMLQAAGAGQYFVLVAFALLGHMRGGPAKAGVLASGLTGLMSGSSIANVVTTGTFTIPLMKKVGFPAYKAGAIEVAASTNGQILPPVMGAAAFLMVEYTNTPYAQVVQHAFLPAILSYLALMYMVHLEAVKADMQGLPRATVSPLRQRLIGWGLTLSGTVIVAFVAYGLVQGINHWLGPAAPWVILPGLAALYVGLLAYSSARPPLPEHLDPADLKELPGVGTTALAGLHFLLPVVVLVWALLVEQLSPGLSAFYACVAMLGVLLTQRPLQAWFRRQPLSGTLAQGWRDTLTSLEDGAKNMMGIGVATATAGIIVGTVSLTGISQWMTELVELMSMGSLILVLLLTAVLCMILGMGLPTTANYIVVATLMAPVVVELAQAHGVEMPLIAVHLFVFYFGIMADDTPPVGLAAFAASGLAQSSPIQTGMQSFTYDLRTAILPFMFVFNTEILLMGITGPLHLLWVVATSLTAMLLFVSVTQGYLLTRSRWWESALLLVVVFTLLRPGWWLDQVYPPYTRLDPGAVAETLAKQPVGETIRLQARVDDGLGEPKESWFSFTRPAGDDPLAALGLTLESRESKWWVSEVGFMSAAEKAGLDMANDNQLLALEIPTQRPAKEWFALPAILLLLGVIALQRRRRNT